MNYFALQYFYTAFIVIFLAYTLVTLRDSCKINIRYNLNPKSIY